MKSSSLRLVVAAILIGGAGLSQAADPFANGDFSLGSTGWFDASYTVATGATGGGVSFTSGSLGQANLLPLSGFDGGEARLLQTFDGLAANTYYTVSFDALGVGYSRIGLNYYSNPPINTIVDVAAGGYGIVHADLLNSNLTPTVDTRPSTQEYGFNNSAFTTYSYTFNSGSAQTWDIWFKTNSENGFKLDNVSISPLATSVPEPESYAMMLAGLGALGFMARRRKSR